MAKKTSLAPLIQACHLVGARAPLWVQGGGGNVSRKNNSLLWIKSSGRRLSDVNEDSGLVGLNDAKLLSACDAIRSATNPSDAYYDVLRKTLVHSQNNERASMESIVHAVLPKEWVLHFHPLTAILVAHSPTRWATFQNVAESMGLKVALIEYAEPGWRLGESLHGVTDCDFIVLKNHGVILQGEGGETGAETVLRQWSECEKRVCAKAGFPEIAALSGPVPNRTVLNQLPATPWRVFFPDAAVFEGRVKKVIQPGENDKFTLIPDAWEKDLAATEIFVATQLLWLADQTITVLTQQEIRALWNMTFEIHRKGEAA